MLAHCGSFAVTPDIETFISAHIQKAETDWPASGGEEFTLQLGNAVIAVRLLSAGLRDLILPVLQHAVMRADNACPQSTIYAVASDAAGWPDPPEEWPFPVTSAAARLRTHWNTASGLALSSDESRGIWHLHDLNRNTGLYWVRSTKGLPYWEAGSPLRHHLNWASTGLNQAMLHAAVIGQQGRSVMLAGPGGSGKSTMTATAIQAGWQTTGDDFVIVSNDDQPISHRLYDLIKLTGMAEDRFPEIVTHALNPVRQDGEKALVKLTSVCPTRFVRSLPVHAILCTSLSGCRKSSIRPISPVATVKALAPSTAAILRTGFADIFAFSSKLARTLPCHEFLIGADPDEGLAVLGCFMESIE